MRPPFLRMCRIHGEELKPRYTASGRESLWCPGRGHGSHKCKSWDVRDNEGEILAIGFLHTMPIILSPDLLNIDIFDAPSKPVRKRKCPRGHTMWEQTEDGAMECLICRDLRQIKKVVAERSRATLIESRRKVKEKEKKFKKSRKEYQRRYYAKLRLTQPERLAQMNKVRYARKKRKKG